MCNRVILNADISINKLMAVQVYLGQQRVEEERL